MYPLRKTRLANDVESCLWHQTRHLTAIDQWWWWWWWWWWRLQCSSSK